LPSGTTGWWTEYASVLQDPYLEFVPEEFEAATADAVLARQRVILHERVTRLEVVIGEAVLRQQVGDATVMHAQVTHLAELVGGCRHVTIRLLPFRR
jgi:hypothetical protein